MNTLAALFRQVASWLDALSAHFALVGGLAVAARTEPRFTRGVDLALTTRVDADAEELARALAAHGLNPVAFVAQADAECLSTVWLPTAGEDGLYVDLRFASSGDRPKLLLWPLIARLTRRAGALLRPRPSPAPTAPGLGYAAA